MLEIDSLEDIAALRESVDVECKAVVHVHVPSATRKQKPVYLRGNPMAGTYRRFNSTDQLLDEEQVRRMLAEQIEDSRDNEILLGFGMDDLDFESFTQYRQLYANRQPDHPWNQLDSQMFLYQIGGWRKDREAGHSGLTRAGLLMFGQQVSIIEAFPNYMLDYQERPEPKAELRWVDHSLGEQVFASLTEQERLVLVTAAIEKTVDHSRMMSILDIHPRDLSQLLARLVDKKLILRNGTGRGTVYFLPDAQLEDMSTGLEASITEASFNSGHLEASSGHLEASSGYLETSSGHWEELQELAKPVAMKGKAPRGKVEEVILALCSRGPLRLDELTHLLNRSAEFLRKHYLQPMVRARRLKLLYPTTPNHPRQAYIMEEPGHDQ